MNRTSRRLVAILGPDAAALPARGLLIADRLALASAVPPADRVELTVGNAPERFQCRVVWRGAGPGGDSDRDPGVALFAITDQGWVPPTDLPPLRWGVFTGPGGWHRAVVAGDDVTVGVNPTARRSPRAWDVLVDGEPVTARGPDRRDRAEPSGPLSTGPVLVGDAFVGLLYRPPVADGPSPAPVLLPGEAILTDPNLRAALAGAGHRPYLDSVELTGVLAPWRLTVPPRGPADLLLPEHDTAPFGGRTALLDKLCGWCLDGACLAGVVVTGPTGRGKTRLGRELALRLQDKGWVTGVLCPDFAPGGEDEIADTTRPLLLVVEDAEDRVDQLGNLVRRIAERPTGYPVRLLLLAHETGRWWRRLNAALRDVAPIFEGGPVRLGPRSGADDDGAAAEALLSQEERRWRETAEAAGGQVSEHWRSAVLLALLDPSTAPAVARGLPGIDIDTRPELADWLVDLCAPLRRHRVRHGPLPGVLAERYLAGCLGRYAGELGDLVSQLGARDPAAAARAMAVLGRSAARTDSDGRSARLLATVIRHHLAVNGPAAVRAAGDVAGGGPLAIALRLVAESELAIEDLLTIVHAIPRPADALAGTATQLSERLVSQLRQAAKEQPRSLPRLASALADGAAWYAETDQPRVGVEWATESVGLYQALTRGDRGAAHLPDLAAALDTQAVNLAAIGSLPEAIGAADQAAARWRDLTESDAAHLVRWCAALDHKADLLRRAGRMTDAAATRAEAVDAWQRRIELGPGTFAPRLAEALDLVADAHAAAGAVGAAQACSERAVARWRQLARHRPYRYLAQLAASLERLAEAEAGVGSTVRAVNLTQEAVSVRERLAGWGGAPDLFELSELTRALSVRLAAVGRGAEALAAAAQARTYARRAAVTDPDRGCLAVADASHTLATRLGELGEWDASVRCGRKTLALYDEVRRRHRHVDPARLCATWNNLAVGLAKLPDGLAESAKAAASAVDFGQRARDQPWTGAEPPGTGTDPRDSTAALAAASATLAAALGMLDAPEEAIPPARDAVDLYRAAGPRHRLGLATALATLSEQYARAGEPEAGLCPAQEALTLLREAAARDPGAADDPERYGPRLSDAQHRFAVRCVQTGRIQDAERAADEAVRTYRDLHETRRRGWRAELAQVLLVRAHLAEIGEDRPNALALSWEALELRLELVAERPAGHRDALADGYDMVCRYLDVMSSPDAVRYAGAAVEARHGTIGLDRPKHLRLLAAAQRRLAEALTGDGRSEAVDVVGQSVATAREAVRAAPPPPDPSGTAALAELATSLSTLSEYLAWTGALVPSAEVAREAADEYTRLAQQDRDRFASELALALAGVARRQWDAGRFGECVESARAAVAAHRDLLDRGAPVRPAYAAALATLAEALTAVAESQVGASSRAEARSVWRDAEEQYAGLAREEPARFAVTHARVLHAQARADGSVRLAAARRATALYRQFDGDAQISVEERVDALRTLIRTTRWRYRAEADRARAELRHVSIRAGGSRVNGSGRPVS